MKANIFACIILLAALCAACVSRPAQLKEIDAIIESDPALALDKLEGVRPDELSPNAYPYYALLMTQAQIKNGIVVTSDSLMRHAYEAYRDCGDRDLRKRAHFYNAQIAYDSGDLRPAMSDVVVAYDIAKTDGDPYWIAKTAEMMSDIFFDVFNYPQSEAYEIEAIENYLKAGRIGNHRYALADLATICLAEGKNEAAINVLDSLFKVIQSEEPFDSALYDYATVPMCSALLMTNQLDSLNNFMPSQFNLRGNEAEFDHALIKSHLLDESESMELLRKAYDLSPDDQHRVRILFVNYQQALSAGNYKNAAELADSLLIYQNRITADVLSESVASAQRDFYVSKSLFETQNFKLTRYILIAVTIVAIVIVILLVVIYKLKLKNRKTELEAKISDLMTIKEQMECSNTEKERLNEALSEKSIALEILFKEKWGAINLLCNEYFELGDSEVVRINLQSRIEKELKKLRSAKGLKDIEAAVDANMGGIISLLRKECDFLKDDDFVFLSLIYAGLSSKAVCLFTDIKYKNFYQKKTRLAKRITDSGAPHKGLFIAKLR